jgi:hypothetical protein
MAAFSYLAMGSGGVDTTDAILAFVIFYGLDPLIDSIKSLFCKRNALNKRGVVEDEFKRFLKTKRKELKSNQPELPFPRSKNPGLTAMTTSETIGYTLAAMLVAVAVERLLSHFCRRDRDEELRLEVATTSMTEQQKSIEALFARESVPDKVKNFVLDTADASLLREGARILIDIISGKRTTEMSPEATADLEGLAEAVDDLKVKDREAYELYRGYIFRAPVTAICQWPDTYKAMGKLSLRLASEREPAAARDAAAMRGGVFALHGVPAT